MYEENYMKNKNKIIISIIAIALCLFGTFIYNVSAYQQTTIYSSSTDSSIAGTGSTSYTTVRNAETGTVTSNHAYVLVGQSKEGTKYYIYRGCIYFDSSFMNEHSFILRGNVSIIGLSEPLFTGRVILQRGYVTEEEDLSYPEKPTTVSDYNRLNYYGDLGSGCLGSDDRVFIPLNNSGLVFIKEGINGSLKNIIDAKFMLRTDKDISGAAPTTSYETTQFYTYWSGWTSQPRLMLVYTYFMNTNIDSISNYVNTTNVTLTATRTSEYTLDNVSLLYRFSNKFYPFNHSVVNNSVDTVDGGLLWLSDRSPVTQYYQTFTTENVSDNILVSNISMKMNKSTSDAFGFYYFEFFECNETGYPELNKFVGNTSYYLIEDVPVTNSFVTCELDHKIVLKPNKKYAVHMRLTDVTNGNFYFGWNTSNTQDYCKGSRFKSYFSTWTEYPSQDFLLKINSAFYYWNSTNNPDSTVPYSFNFSFPFCNGLYEFKSLGCYKNVYENCSYDNDTWCYYYNETVIPSIQDNSFFIVFLSFLTGMPTILYIKRRRK